MGPSKMRLMFLKCGFGVLAPRLDMISQFCQSKSTAFRFLSLPLESGSERSPPPCVRGASRSPRSPPRRADARTGEIVCAPTRLLRALPPGTCDVGRSVLGSTRGAAEDSPQAPPIIDLTGAVPTCVRYLSVLSTWSAGGGPEDIVLSRGLAALKHHSHRKADKRSDLYFHGPHPA